MNKYTAVLPLVFLATTTTYSMDVDDAVVPNASYMIYEGAQGIVGGVPATSRYVTFYTCNGDLIQKVEHPFSFPLIERKLDRSAPKPMPVTYQITSIGFDTKKGTSCDFILFYDKNDNRIASYRYNKACDQITIFSPTGKHIYNFSRLIDLKVWSDFPLNLIMLNQGKKDD